MARRRTTRRCAPRTTHREVTDLADERPAAEVRGTEPVEDIRDVAAAEPAPVHEDVVRVPSGEEVAELGPPRAALRSPRSAPARRPTRNAGVDDRAADLSGDGLDDAAELEARAAGERRQPVAAPACPRGGGRRTAPRPPQRRPDALAPPGPAQRRRTGRRASSRSAARYSASISSS